RPFHLAAGPFLFDWLPGPWLAPGRMRRETWPPSTNFGNTGTMTLRDEPQSASAASPKPGGRDERLREIGLLRQALRRPELGAAAGCLLVLFFFAVFAGDSGLYSARGVVNFLVVSSQLGILAVAVALLM